jgi:ketosteroid isomerase-like protein
MKSTAHTYGPYPHGDDRFAVRFVYDITQKPTGRRVMMDEVAVFTVANGKIVREEFYYKGG